MKKKEWADQWLNDMTLAVKNQDKNLIIALFKAHDEFEIDWSDDVSPAMAKEYADLVRQAKVILLS